MKIYRTLGIVMYLLNRKKVTARELADHFEVSVRTIYRDLKDINQAGIPVVSYHGSDGGYGIIEEFKLDKQVFTGEELDSILVALKGLDRTLDDREIKDIREKIKNLAPEFTKDSFPDNKYYIDYTPWGISGVQKDKLELIEGAINNNQLIEFTYRSLKGERTRRRVEPMTLVLRGSAWYLYSFCRLRDDYRIFKIYRIKDLKKLEESFKRKRQEFKDSELLENWQREDNIVDLVLRFSPESAHRAEEWFDENQLTRGDDGTLLAEVSYPEDEWLYGFILSFGEQVEVLKPEYLREIIMNKAARIKSVYN
ncbi:MAG: helix-turn-helix transcriptional regulator [Halanaerobiales bacterium]